MEFSKVSGTKTDHKVTIYALSTCVWCKLTKQFLSDNGVAYEFVDVDLLDETDKRKVHETILTRGGSLSYPTTIVDDKKIITGFRKDQLKEALGI
ncbi:MAG: glutaredoxin family protein [Candidatus Bathyarchaeota archaeon]|nr:glutaredoxin family protein [Candidatus Bathyarchaeota archaeon]